MWYFLWRQTNTQTKIAVNLKPYIIAIALFGVISEIPLKGELEVTVWGICMYGILTVCLYLITKLTKSMVFNVLSLLAFGKFIDQFYNPYGYHLVEFVWNLIVIVWAIRRLISNVNRDKK